MLELITEIRRVVYTIDMIEWRYIDPKNTLWERKGLGSFMAWRRQSRIRYYGSLFLAVAVPCITLS